MSQTYIFLDLETTGLKPEQDEIIEVAFLKYENGRQVDALTSLVKPKRSIPEYITKITGITDGMVAKAPSIDMLRDDILSFVSNHVVVGHNVSFDLGFLQANYLIGQNQRLDTVSLASILMPEAGRFALQYLVGYLDFPKEKAHRAEEDTLQTARLFYHLERIGRETDSRIRHEIIKHGQKLGWPETYFFEQITKSTESAIPLDRLFTPDPIEGEEIIAPPVDEEPEPPFEQVDPEIIHSIMGKNGNLSQVFEEYEPRPQQIEMMQAVTDALNHQKHLFVEAGTGTGKSLAYLTPCALWATQNEQRVVISTNTLNLQDQLINKDIPLLQKMLPAKVRVAVRKGKRNYLCIDQLKEMRKRGPRNGDEMTVFARVLLWLPYSKTGDVNEIVLRSPQERNIWRRLSAEGIGCSKQNCSPSKCPIQYARRRAEVSHIVIVNHSLLLADIATGGGVLPSFRNVIIDEGHHLESSITSGMSFSADKAMLDNLFEELHGESTSTLNRLQIATNNAPAQEKGAMSSEILDIIAELQRAEDRVQELFSMIRFFAKEFWTGSSDFSQSLRLTDTVRSKPLFNEVELGWSNLRSPLVAILRKLIKLANGIDELTEDGVSLSGGDEIRLDLAKKASYLEEIIDNMDAILREEDENRITWIESWKSKLSLHAAPLHVGPLVEEHLLETMDSMIVTSATMRTAPNGRQKDANFDYIRSRLNAQKVDAISVGSPFEYDKSTLLYLCTDIPEPKEPGYQEAVAQAIVDTAIAYKGKTMVLFTANKQLRDVATLIEPVLSREKIQLLQQAGGVSRQLLTKQFKNPETDTVLLGSRSFWEGVDIAGEALSAVIIVKLPFDVPTDPIVDARSSTFDNSFMQYAIPEAVLRFRQGFGRLIRRKTDEGVVIILDKRVLTKRYGELFLRALPECTVLRQRSDRIQEILGRWQNRTRK